jgi:5-deoxy-glucuronate isomerase
MKNIIVRNTASHKGRQVFIHPGAFPDLELLSVGRTVLEAHTPPVEIASQDAEFIFTCLHGAGTVSVDGNVFHVKPYDAVYAPRESRIEIATGSELDATLDIVECSAPVSKRYPVRHVRFEEVKDDATLHLSIGAPSASRELYQLVTSNVEAGRLMCGPTFSNKGNWTSFPPHEHINTLEEVYLYFDMPAPAFGIQFVYTNTHEPELMLPVREDDAVVVSGGYHPNVAVPGHAINFLWMLCAKREREDRKYGVVNVQPEFKT